MIALLVLFKPYIYNLKALDYKHSIANNGSKSPRSPEQLLSIRPSVRQIINYSLIGLIEVLLFITNSQNESGFVLYIPILILVILVALLVLTGYFLIVDGVLQYDLNEFKLLFFNSDE